MLHLLHVRVHLNLLTGDYLQLFLQNFLFVILLSFHLQKDFLSSLFHSLDNLVKHVSHLIVGVISSVIKFVYFFSDVLVGSVQLKNKTFNN